MRSGAVYGTAGMLDGLIDRMLEELGGKATIVACGGTGEQSGTVRLQCKGNL